MKNLPLFIFILLVSIASRAFAVAEVKDPLSRVYKVDSASVFSATIVKFNPDGQVIEAKLATVYKGDAPTGPIRILTKDYPALSDELKAAKDQAAGMNIVLFPSARTVLLHIADHWYGGACGARPGVYILNERKSDHDGTFPGTTATLLTALDELKAGHSTLVDVFPPITLPKPEKIGTLPANSTSLAASENPRDKTTEFTVTSSKNEVLSFSFDGKTLTPKNTAGASTLSGKGELATPGAGKILAATNIMPTDGAKPDSAFIVTTTGLYHVAINNPSAPIEDDLRLTGSKLTSYYSEHKNGFTSASIVSIDVNGDNRPDLIILTPEGTLTLLNRGFGCYLVNKTIASPLLTPPQTPSNPPLNPTQTTPPLLASTPHTLYLLDPDGSLYRYDFPSK